MTLLHLPCAPILSAVPPSSLRVITYPEARHAFDVRSLPEPMQYRSGVIGYNAVAAATSWKTVLDFLR
jgi:dienelactone hydrolase